MVLGFKLYRGKTVVFFFFFKFRVDEALGLRGLGF